MGRAEKALQPLHDKPLVTHALERLRPQVDALAVNANHAHDAYRQFGVPLWPDLRNDLAGPLAGMEVGQAICRNRMARHGPVRLAVLSL